MIYDTGTGSSARSRNFERSRHEIALTTAKFEEHFAQFSVTDGYSVFTMGALVSAHSQPASV